jgi:hypothetical protein
VTRERLTPAVPMEVGNGGGRATISPRAVLETLGLVVAPATVLTAVMFYFGWARTRALALEFGIHPNVLGYATQDYLIDSVDALFVPLAGLLLALLVLLQVHWRIDARMLAPGHDRARRRLTTGLFIAGVTLLAVAAAAATAGGDILLWGWRVRYARWLAPLGIVLGLVSLEYAAHLRRAGGPGGDSAAGATTSPRAALTTRAVSGGLIVLALFWGITAYAQDVGRLRAERLAQGVGWQELPAVVVFSPRDLQIQAPGITAARCQSVDAEHLYRYSGLRLFAYSNDKYFLLPASWPEKRGQAILLPDDPGLRLELMPGRVVPGLAEGCSPLS